LAPNHNTKRKKEEKGYREEDLRLLCLFSWRQ
jgi:hypothetical protein